MISLPDELKELKRFHGHLGPYAVLGYMMGQIARKRYPQKIFATLHSGTQRPMSCMADGVQFSSCCTLGKNNIKVLENGKAEAQFSDGSTQISIGTKHSIIEQIDSTCTHQNEELLAMDIFHTKIEDLFTITEDGSASFVK